MKLVRKLKEVDRYVSNIKEHSDFGIENITVEHRSNNPKRDFLFVNKKQCKHIPVSGADMVKMCQELAKLVNEKLANNTNVGDKVLVVGFAETATAIGNVVADSLCCESFVLQTTRENVPHSKQLLSFEEEHSHATTQKLLIRNTEDTDKFLNQFKYVLFVEDEISTGNTILNFIEEFDKVKQGMKFGVASVCNWQSVENQNKFKAKGIDTFALITGELKNADIKMSNEQEPGHYFFDSAKDYEKRTDKPIFVYRPRAKVFGSELFEEERLGHIANRDLSKLYELVDEVLDRDKSIQSVRVIGTEEFMYIPIKVAEYIENNKLKDVVCHSTTRSPIDKARTSAFGCADAIISKNKLTSLYEDERVTYLYNLDEFTDAVILITDGRMSDEVANEYYEMLKDRTKTIVVLAL